MGRLHDTRNAQMFRDRLYGNSVGQLSKAYGISVRRLRFLLTRERERAHAIHDKGVTSVGCPCALCKHARRD